ncbi:MAG: hypothetical protein FJ303_13820 [Planctomycetes bacterium]|nr:hypothetical protein [Planctomycetota bacterium]
MNTRLTVIAIIVAFVGAGITWMMISSSEPELGVKGKVYVTKSGLKFMDEAIGDGKIAERGRKVTIHVTVLDADGNPQARSKEPIIFVVGKKTNDIPPAWHEGVTGMKEKGVRQIQSPAALNDPGEAFVPDGDVIFRITLLKVE